MIGAQTNAPVRSSDAGKAWLRALELTVPIARQPDRIFPSVIEELAGRYRGRAPACSATGIVFTYRELFERSNQYARWALDQGLAKGDTVCLMMRNRPGIHGHLAGYHQGRAA